MNLNSVWNQVWHQGDAKHELDKDAILQQKIFHSYAPRYGLLR